VIAKGQRARRDQEAARNAANAVREAQAHDARTTQVHRTERVARNIAKCVHEKGVRTVGAVRGQLNSRDKNAIPAALAYAEARGWVRVDNKAIEPGESQPSEAA
jgi:hypothetical protein